MSLKEACEATREKVVQDRDRDRGDRQRSRDEWEQARRRYDRDRSDRQYRRRGSNSRSRSRSRSRERPLPRRRSRSRSPLSITSSHTNSEDPKMLNARVFIGNLPTEKLSREDIEDIYKKYGKLLGVSLLRGFGFVQFEREEDAKKAVEMEAGGLLKGQRIDVKMAADGRRGGGSGRGMSQKYEQDYVSPEGRRGGPRGGRGGRGGPPRLGRDRSPPRDPTYRNDPYDSFADPYRRSVPPGRDPYERDMYDDPYRDAFRDPYRDAVRLPAIREPPAPLPPAIEKPPYDCEIIAIDNQDRTYVQQMESRLSTSQMLIQILSLSEEGQLTSAMEAANRKKLPYVIVVRRQNEMHRSLTLNILHGAPQEHRNMPYEDAMKLVARNFETYMQELREKAARAPAPAAVLSVARPGLPPVRATQAVVAPAPKPEFVLPDSDTHYLLNLLADNRYLALDELNKVLRYLDLRYERLARQQGVPDRREMIVPSSLKDESAISQQQEALKKNILSILNGSEDKPVAAQPLPGTARPLLSTSYPGLTGVAPPPPPTQDNNSQGGNLSGINLDNPNVQKALDNLLSSGSLKTISSITDTSTTQSHHLQAQSPMPGHALHQAMTTQTSSPYGQNQQFRNQPGHPGPARPARPAQGLPSPGQGLLSHPGQGSAQGLAGPGRPGSGQQGFGGPQQAPVSAPTSFSGNPSGYPNNYGGQGYNIGQGAGVPPPPPGQFSQARY